MIKTVNFWNKKMEEDQQTSSPSWEPTGDRLAPIGESSSDESSQDEFSINPTLLQPNRNDLLTKYLTKYKDRSLKFSDRMCLVSSYIQGANNKNPTVNLYTQLPSHDYHMTSSINTPTSVDGDGSGPGGGHRQLSIQEVTTRPVNGTADGEETEGAIAFLVQFMIPFLMAGIGQLMAGLILDKIQHWTAIQYIPNIYILIPALLGLKGNCEMCLAARLSTQANVHSHESTHKFFSFVLSNLGIVQVHSICIGFLAATGANTLGWIPQGIFNINNALLLTASCLFTASMTSLVLGSVMICVFFLSKLCHINPDNIATPIAASLGDLTTVFILANTTALLVDLQKDFKWISLIVIALCFFIVPFWWKLAHRNVMARESLLTGWQPVVIAMIISSVGGLIMEYSIINFRGIAVYQLIVNGVAGNLVAVQASKLSTYLHKNYTLGEHVPFSYSIRKVFFGSDANSHTARILLAMTIPGHLIFNYAVASLNAGHTSTTPIFMIIYLLTSLIQVSILLYICHIMIYKMWRNEVNPDNSAIPYLTAIADFLGMAFLSAAFEFLYLIGDRDDDIGD
ncbi:solute carrier family 41 member 1-like [Chrysoperla carnea]|uniref:solute carrier family 41 member 1-like n=1 Tax=Chrysoperla carnea TaxID=189513 RepID=UPI001D08C3EB|nr:solute carrier family 41 member 1-like [Chrysoperla carnea]XP_044741597.1 solute carrier family 41 member 1-like [Chrysoperla carnea]